MLRSERRRGGARWTLPAALAALLLTAAHPAAAVVLREDELEGRSTELGLLARSFSFLFAGQTLRPPYNVSDANPSGIGLLDLRLSFVHKTPRWSAVVHGQLTTMLSSHGSFVLGPSLGRGTPPPRWLPLRAKLADEPTTQVTAALDWAYATLVLGPVTITAGRQPITFGRGQLWHPSDLVSMFSLTEVDTEYKPGADALRLDWQVASRTALTLIGAPGELEDDSDAGVSLRGSAFLARLKQGLGKGELGLLAGFVRRDVVLGLDGFYDLTKADVYAEATVTLLTDESLAPNTDRLCSGLPGCDAGAVDRAVVRAVVGTSFKPLDKVTLNVELFYNGFGSWDRAEYLAIALSERVGIGEVVGLGALYSGFVALWEVHPLVKLSLLTLANLRDPSALLFGGVTYDLAANAQLVGGAYMPVGRVPDVSAGPLAIVPRSEYGAYPYFFFVELKAAL